VKAANVFPDHLGCRVDDPPGRTIISGTSSCWRKPICEGCEILVVKYGEHMQPHLVEAINGTMTDIQITDAIVARKKIATNPGASCGHTTFC
jgi:hypothetical protein